MGDRAGEDRSHPWKRQERLDSLISPFPTYRRPPYPERFGRGRLFALGIAFLPVVFVAELAFSDRPYVPDPTSEWWRRRGLA